MTGSSNQLTVLQQLLDLHDVDQEIRALKRERQQLEAELGAMEDGVTGLESSLERLDTELEQARTEARRSERAADEKRDALDRIRGRVNQVQNEKQYSAASLEFDLVRQDLRKLEDLALGKLQAVEDIEGRRNETLGRLEEARSGAGPLRDDIGERLKQLEEELLIKRDRRHNFAIRLEPGALGLYDRIRAGRSEVAVAKLTEEAVCGYCFTSVTIQQEMQIREMKTLICCEGCGVILCPRDFQR
jgi:predicted  nucleic acid-binding Zn-ribbon protein